MIYEKNIENFPQVKVDIGKFARRKTLIRFKKMKLNQLRVKSNSLFKRVLAIFTLILTPLFAMAADDVIAPPQEFNPMTWDWTTLLSLILGILIILVVARAFDIGSLTEKITGKTIVSWNNVNAWVAIIFLILGLIGVWYEMVYHGKYLLLGDAASKHGETLDSMFYWTFGFTFFVFIVTEILLFYFVFKYRYSENRKALYYFHNNKLELIWTIVPAIVLTFLVLRGFGTWNKITMDVDPKSEPIEVFAYQFGWKARYAGDDHKLGNANFNLISSGNPLGVAEDKSAEELVKELEGEISKLKALQNSVADSAKAWKYTYDRYVSTGMKNSYVDEFKKIKEQYNDIVSGAYERQLEKDIKRKTTAIHRISEYKKDKDFFNGAANDDKITTEIVLIKNRPYIFKFRARDVIHSAYFPEFRAQMNCVPGMPTSFAFTPIKTTEEVRASKNNKEFDYYLYCNKICGAAHYNMKIKVTVVGSEQEYNEWLAQQAPFVAPAAPSTAPVEVKPADTTAAVKKGTVAIK